LVVSNYSKETIHPPVKMHHISPLTINFVFFVFCFFVLSKVPLGEPPNMVPGVREIQNFRSERQPTKFKRN